MLFFHLLLVELDIKQVLHLVVAVHQGDLVAFSLSQYLGGLLGLVCHFLCSFLCRIWLVRCVLLSSVLIEMPRIIILEVYQRLTELLISRQLLFRKYAG